MKFDILFFGKLVEKFQVPLKSEKHSCTLYEDRNIFMIMSRSVLLTMCSGSKKTVEKIKTQILCSKLFWGGGS